MTGKSKYFLFFLSAVFVGIISGLFGGGGGLLCVPLLKKLLGLTDKETHATTILVTAIISIPTIIVYITNIGVFDFTVLQFVSLGGLLGGLIGFLALKGINDRVLKIIFIFILIVAGVKMIF